MLSLQEISDRLEIQQLLVDYASAIDGKDFDGLDAVFTADAHIDYSAMGRTMCFNPMQMKMPDGNSQVMFLGLWYLDKFVRTPQGWRISERVEEKCYMHNAPGMLGAAINKE